jgi:hypothetical protein
MNVVEFNLGALETLPHYIATTILLTLFTAYIVITLQTHSSFHPPNSPLRIRVAWPGIFLWRVIHEKINPQPKKMADENV